jgi:hypothetical protein
MINTELKTILKNITNGKKHITNIINRPLINSNFNNDVLEALILTENEDKIIECMMIKLDQFKTRTLYVKFENNSVFVVVGRNRLIISLFDGNVEGLKREKILLAFRYATRENGTTWKAFNVMPRIKICEKCNVSGGDFHIDHSGIPFIKIIDDFIYLHRIDFFTIKLDPDYGLTDKILKHNWVHYHDSIAIYRDLCYHCNESNGCGNYISTYCRNKIKPNEPLKLMKKL